MNTSNPRPRKKSGTSVNVQVPDENPYIEYYKAAFFGDDEAVERALQEISSIPAGSRYTARIVKGLKLAFDGFDSANITVDKEAGFTEADVIALDGDHMVRAFQFCMSLATLHGIDEMERMISDAVALAIAASKDPATHGGVSTTFVTTLPVDFGPSS